MPLLRQLEFAFEQFATRVCVEKGAAVAQALRLPNSWTATGAVALQFQGRNVDLETQARNLLRAHGATRIARELRVEWNSRLKTAAGRADYRQQLISLNPRLFEHPHEIDRTLRHELAHLLAQFRGGRPRISPHGDERRKPIPSKEMASEKCWHILPIAVIKPGCRCLNQCH